jgi:hypothetical protein
MTKTHILDEIRRTAEANGGAPPGARKFESETGIRKAQWLHYWARWGDAQREAGFAANVFTSAFDNSKLFDSYAKLAREIGRLPTEHDLTFRRRNDPGFPNEGVFRRLGSKQELISQVAAHCRNTSEYEDVLRMCENYIPRRKDEPDDEMPVGNEEIGFVYLIRSGRYYKIGKTNSAGRREREIAIQLPEKAATVHVIRTDDPTGIEAYWHGRFADRRKNGEWFELAAADVRAFKRRKFM